MSTRRAKPLVTLLSLVLVLLHLTGVTATPKQIRLLQRQNYLPLVQSPMASDGFTELAAARSASNQVFIKAAGQRTLVRFKHYTAPVFFQDATSGVWLPIDTRIVADDQTRGYRNAAGGFTAQFAGEGRAAGQSLLRVSRTDQPELRLLPASAGITAPVVDGNTITYPAIADASDLVYQVHAWGVKEEIVLHSAAARPAFTLLLDAPGITPREQADKSWLLQDQQGRTIWRIPPPVGADAQGVAAPLTLTVAPVSTSRWRMTLSVDPAWLTSRDRVFPVRLDPSLADPRYIFDDSYVQQNAPDILSYNQARRFLGYSVIDGQIKGATRIFTQVDLSFLPAGLRGDQINRAELVYNQYLSQATGTDASGRRGFSSSIYPALDPWHNETLTWNNQPAIGPAIQAGQFVTAELGQKRWPITDWVRRVRDGATPNYGVTIRADDESRGGGFFWAGGCLAFCNFLPENIPYLQIEAAIDSELNPALDTWSFPNRAGQPTFDRFVADYGMPATTHLITETRRLGTTDVMTLPLGLESVGITATLPLTLTAAIEPGPDAPPNAQLIPKPVSYAFEQVIVKRLYDDAFVQAYEAALEGGLCAGMAATVADFHSLSADRLRPEDYGGSSTVRSIPDQPTAQSLIETYHGRQVSSQVLNWLAGQGRYDAVGLYNHLVDRMTGDWRADPEIISIVKGANCDDIEIGHALLPYKVVPQPGNRARVYVYDPNYVPGSAADVDNRYIEFDLTANTWSYQLAPATSTRPAINWVGQTLYSTPLRLFRERPVLPHQSGNDVMVVDGGNRLLWGGGMTLFGGNRLLWGEADGTFTGCVLQDNAPTFVQELPHTYRFTPMNGGAGTRSFPDAILFPAGREWSFSGAGSDGSATSDLLLFGPHSLAGMISTASPTARDTAMVDASFRSLTVQTTEVGRPVTAYQMHETADWTRVYAISNARFVSNEPLTLTVDPTLASLEVINRSSTAQRFDLGFAQIGAGQGTLLYQNQPLGAQERRIYTPIDWSNLAHSPVLVAIDLGADGSIDRYELIGGAVFPAATSSAHVPDKVGQEFPIITHNQTAPGQFGWVDLDRLLGPAEEPVDQPTSGDPAVLRKWLAAGANPGLAIGGRLIGVAGTHGNLFKAIGSPTPGEEALYHIGDIMVVPLYDQIVDRQGAQPMSYRISGFAVVRITESSNQGGDDAACTGSASCRKRVIGQLLWTVRP